MAERLGYRVIGTVKSVKGTCSWGHKVGDKIELSGHNTGGYVTSSITMSFRPSPCFNLAGSIPGVSLTALR